MSRFSIKPIHLFVFTRQMLVQRYCTADRDLVIGGFTYLSAQIERDAIKQTAERAKDKLKIKAAYVLSPVMPDLGWPATQPLGDWWRPYIPSDPIKVVCLSTTYGSVDPPTVDWMGWATQPVYGDVEIELSCDPNAPRGDAINQGAKWQRACFKSVYSTGIRGCNLIEADFAIPGECGAGTDALSLVVPEFIGTPFSLNGGTLYWTRSNGLVEERPIMAHNQVTGAVQILWGGLELDEGTLVVGVPNCPGTWVACSARRPDPENHYGGAIYKPVRDPVVEGVPMSWG